MAVTTKIYEVQSISHNGKLHSWDACYTRPEAEQKLIDRSQGDNKNWADKYHKRWWIEEIDTTGMFSIPSQPPPRDLFTAKTRQVKSDSPSWDTLHVDIADGAGNVVGSYDRNYTGFYRTFEPFRQADKMFALISPDYTATSVMDLATGKIIATEQPDSMGFCPTGFYVPDWWDIHDDGILPGSMYWDADMEQPVGDFGFVWGCIWGDDSSWKVQFLDLSKIQQGEIARDQRFGYVELATNPKLDAKDFICCWCSDGKWTVRFSALTEFDLASGAHKPHEW